MLGDIQSVPRTDKIICYGILILGLEVTEEQDLLDEMNINSQLILQLFTEFPLHINFNIKGTI